MNRPTMQRNQSLLRQETVLWFVNDKIIYTVVHLKVSISNLQQAMINCLMT